MAPARAQSPAPSSTASSIETTPDPDLAATRRLREAFHQVPGLSTVTLEVRGGVAVLRGQVSSFEERMEADRLADKVDGIIATDNGIEVKTSVRERLSPALTRLTERGVTFLSYIPLLGVAVLTLLAFAGAGKLFVRWEWFFAKISHNLFIRDLLKHLASFVFMLVGSLIALELLQATALVGAVLGTAGVLGVAIGFAFKDLAENSLASILLSLRQPFSPNDLVDIDGKQGMVVRLTSRATILLTLDGNHLRIPNATVFKATILNYTRNPERRFDFTVGVSTQEELSSVQALAISTLSAAPGVLEKPAPVCAVEALGESTVDLKVMGWVDQRQSDWYKTRGEAIRRVKEAFDEAGIQMPAPIFKVELERSAPKQETVKPVMPVTPDLSPETHLEQRVQEERLLLPNDLLEQKAARE